MTVKSDQQLWIKEATSVKNIHSWEHETKVCGRKKTLVQSLKQFHAHFYLLYEKSMTHAMVTLQGLHSGKAFRHPYISASMGLKWFYPMCLKLGGNTETIAIHLREGHYQMAIVCDICQVFASMNTQNVLDQCAKCKVKHNKECAEHDASEGCRKALKSHKEKKSKSGGKKGASELLGKSC